MKRFNSIIILLFQGFLLLMVLLVTPAIAQNVQEPAPTGYDVPGRPMTAAWIWIVGIAIFVVLLISILRPRKR